jgi:hypothetical protein
VTVREWWDNAKEHDQVALLNRLGIDRALAGVPWAFLDQEVQDELIRRVKIDVSRLALDWRRS